MKNRIIYTRNKQNLSSEIIWVLIWKIRRNFYYNPNKYISWQPVSNNKINWRLFYVLIKAYSTQKYADSHIFKTQTQLFLYADSKKRKQNRSSYLQILNNRAE
jgi:hypothetical protein